MLHYTTVEPETLELLKNLSNEPALKDFILVGGTALSLQNGHRKSIDLDFFCYGQFDAKKIANIITSKYGYKEVRFSDTMSIGYINGIKVDFVKAQNQLTENIVTQSGIRLADEKDIAAMKLWAIAKDGTRLKDYIDIACLSCKMSLNDMLNHYCQAYQTDSAMFATKKLLYYKTIENYESINMISGEYKWELIKQRLEEMVKQPDTIFENLPLLRKQDKKQKISKARSLLNKWNKLFKKTTKQHK